MKAVNMKRKGERRGINNNKDDWKSHTESFYYSNMCVYTCIIYVEVILLGVIKPLQGAIDYLTTKQQLTKAGMVSF